ncbi:MAG TPA: SH3 domain-containing protein [Pyrinomonadaceae bacterium]|nr:SH3 domain-containing protein [Pyrinomonadaceae bacterium]
MQIMANPYRKFWESFILLLLVFAPVMAQSEEVKLARAQSKITTVSAMRMRKAPQASAEEVTRLKLGTVVDAIAHSANQDTIGGKTDYWYRVNLQNGQSGWLFGGLLRDYAAAQRQQLLREIIDARLKAENTEFADRQEIYNLAASASTEAKDANTRAEFELLKLLALANWAITVPVDLIEKSPYREWYKTHGAKVILNEFAGGHNLNSDVLWELETKYHTLPIADRIAWEAAQNEEPHDCEGDEVCGFFVGAGEITYLERHPNGARAGEALRSRAEALTDEVINSANSTGGDQYEVEQRTQLLKLLGSLRAALAKTSAPEKNEVLAKLQRIKSITPPR